MGVEGAPRGFLAAVNADDDRKAAGIPGRLRLFCQRLGDHTARHMVDGRRAQRLVQPRLCHAAYTVPAVDRNGAGGIRQQRDLRHHRQTGRGIYVIASVLDDGASLGVRSPTVSGARPVSSSLAAPAAPIAAQVPVV